MVLIKHGSTYCRVHPCQLKKKKTGPLPEDVSTTASIPRAEEVADTEPSTADQSTTVPEYVADESDDDDVDVVTENAEVDEEVGPSGISNDFVENSVPSESRVLTEIQSESVLNGSVLPKSKSTVDFKSSGDWKVAKVLSKQPKLTVIG